jgi:hypothetical protein
MTISTGYFIARLEKLLEEGFSAQGDSLEAKLQNASAELPDDLRESLSELAQESYVLEQTDKADLLQFAFRCGLLHERLETLAQNRLAANIAFLAPDGTSPLELEKNDFDALARFVDLRDRFLRVVADYTLKFLLVSVILLVLGVSLGLI